MFALTLSAQPATIAATMGSSSQPERMLSFLAVAYNSTSCIHSMCQGLGQPLGAFSLPSCAGVQVKKCADSGADMVRITVQGKQEATACYKIREQLFKDG